MKKYLFIFTILSMAACSQTAGNRQKEQLDSTKLSTSLIHNPHTASGVDSQALSALPEMDFTDTMHDFGTLHEGETVLYLFHFKNNGRTPLLISGATGSCGCTVADFPRDPVKPGETGVMKVQFRSAGHPGHQEKTVTINSNSKKGDQYLYIKADVTPEK